MKYAVVINIAPRVIEGTAGCHEYLFEYCRTKKEATLLADSINRVSTLGIARVEKR